MARMHARRRGSSGSKRPFIKEKPDWVSLEPREVEELVAKLASEGKSSAMIGLVLRDQYAVPSVPLVTGKSVRTILEERSMVPRLPEDLRDLMKRAVALNEHLGRNRKDLHNRRSLQLIESKIRRLAKYYAREGRLPENWKYSLETAKLEAE